MGKLTTDNYEESILTGKVYLDKEFYLNLPKPNIIPKRCKYCATPLLYGMEHNLRALGYCSQWCFDFRKEAKPSHYCKKCGVEVESYKRYKNYKGKEYANDSGVYPKYCKSCSPYHKKTYEKE